MTNLLEGDPVTAEISPNPWARLDDLLGVEIAAPVDEGIGPVAFYGRCSTEDNQDPETSRAWQLSNAQKFVEPLGGIDDLVIVVLAVDVFLEGVPTELLDEKLDALGIADDAVDVEIDLGSNCIQVVASDTTLWVVCLTDGLVLAVDPDSGENLYELEHEVRSVTHPLYARPLVNRNPAQTNRDNQVGLVRQMLLERRALIERRLPG